MAEPALRLTHGRGVVVPRGELRLVPEQQAAITVKSDAEARAVAVATFRRIADQLEAGALRGGRCEWREGAAMVTVELDERAGEVRLVRTTFERG